MSLNVVTRAPQIIQEPSSRPPRRLAPVPTARPRRRPKLAYAILALAGALTIGAAQIGLSLAITQDSFVLADLTAQQRTLDLRTDAIQEDLTGLSSPQALASSAASLGMVVAGSPSYLRLSDGAVFGAGSGAAGASTVDPHGAGAVSNALLQLQQQQASIADDSAASPETATSQDLPPAITDGLPSPTTR